MDTVELNNYLNEFQNETDRAAAVLAGCYLDHYLESLLKSFFIDDQKFIDGQIIGSSTNSVLDSFSKRIKLAYALGLLRKSEFDDLNTIKKIRNEFAHKLHGLTFETDKIRDLCSNLIIPNQTVPKMKNLVKVDDTPRFRYTIAVGMIGNFISYRAKDEAARRTLPQELTWS